MKRLRGWDAVLLYSETPNVHMHTLKLAVIELDDLKGRKFGVEEFRKVIGGRLYKLDPFRYQLIDIPLKMHHPMWRENCEVDLDYHVRPYRVDSPGGRRQLDEAVGRIASTPLDRSKPLWEMYFIEGLANGRIAVLGKIHHALADGVASANLLARGMDLQEGPQSDRDSYATDPAPSKGELVRSAFADHIRHIGRLPGVLRYTAQGVSRVRKSSKKFSPELTRPFTPPPTFMNHKIDRGTQIRDRDTGIWPMSRRPGSTWARRSTTWCWRCRLVHCGNCCLRYDGHADHPLLASVPVSFDFSRERISGNYFTGMMVAVPTDCENPLDWVRNSHDGRSGGQGKSSTRRPGAGEPMVGVLPACTGGGAVPLARRTRTARTRC